MEKIHLKLSCCYVIWQDMEKFTVSNDLRARDSLGGGWPSSSFSITVPCGVVQCMKMSKEIHHDGLERRTPSSLTPPNTDPASTSVCTISMNLFQHSSLTLSPSTIASHIISHHHQLQVPHHRHLLTST